MPINKREFNILVIEDNPGDFALVEEFLLERIKMLTIAHAESYQEATKLLSVNITQFDIVLLDLSLPDKTGLPLIKDVVELLPNTPVIVLTGYADFDFGVESLGLGISDYILKEELTPISLYKSIIYSMERKKTISALEVSEKKYSELFHLSPLPMFVFEEDSFKFLDANDAFIKHYGYTKDELLLMNVKQIRPIEEVPLFEEGIEKSAGGKVDTSWGIFRHLKKNGEIMQVDIQSNFIDYKGKKARVTIATDITERLNYINAIEQQNEKLREISWLQSHVVRAPVARIMGLVQVFNDPNGSADDKGMALDYILISANELTRLLETSRIRQRLQKTITT